MRRITRLEKDLDRVYDALNDGAIDKAIRDAERLHAGNPGDAEAILALAYVRRASGRYEEAVAGARRASSLLPDDPDPRVLEASSLLELDRFEEALGAVTSAPASMAGDPYLVALEVELLGHLKRRKELGAAVARLEKTEVAEAETDAWLDRLDALADALVHCGFRREADRVSDIADALDDAIYEDDDEEFEGDPQGRPLLITDAVVIVAAIRRRPELLRKFLDGEPASFDGLGTEQGREDPAAVAFVDTLLRWTEGGAPLVHAGEGATPDIRKAVDAVNAGDGITARQLAQRTVDAEPGNVTALAVLGHAAALRGNYVKALDWFTHAVALAPADAGLHAHRCCAAAMTGNDRVALEAMEASLAASSQNDSRE